MIFQSSLSNSKSPQFSRTLLSILVNINSAVVYMVSILSLIFCSPILFPGIWGPFKIYQPQLVSPFTSCSTVLLSLWKDPSIFQLFRFLLRWYVGTEKSITCLLIRIGRYIFMSMRILYVSFSRKKKLVYVYTNL